MQIQVVKCMTGHGFALMESRLSFRGSRVRCVDSPYLTDFSGYLLSKNSSLKGKPKVVFLTVVDYYSEALSSKVGWGLRPSYTSLKAIFFCFDSIAACAAARRATGIRYGEHDT
jgi:hypothetical protein